MLRKAGLAGKIARTDLEDQKPLLDLFTKSAADDPASFFRKRRREGAFAFVEIVGAYDSPSTPGIAYPLLHYCFGQVNGKSGV